MYTYIYIVSMIHKCTILVDVQVDAATYTKHVLGCFRKAEIAWGLVADTPTDVPNCIIPAFCNHHDKVRCLWVYMCVCIVGMHSFIA